jgi:hypothetical protein
MTLMTIIFGGYLKISFYRVFHVLTPLIPLSTSQRGGNS